MMAGAFDRETLSFSTADEQAKAAGSRAAAVDAAAQAKEQAAYTAGKSTTGQTLAKQKTTIENLAARANEITDPTKRKAFVESSKAALGDVKLGLQLQAIIDKAENASDIAKDPNNLMNSDSIFTSSAKTGVSNSGKYYVQGKEVSQQEYVNTVGSETGVGRGGAGGGTGGSGAGNLTGIGGPGTSADQAARKSAYDILLEEFNRYGLGALVEPLKGLVMDNVSPSEFSLRLQQTDAYKQRFSANADRIAKGLTALRPAEYLAMEDQYQNIMRNYGLPASYYSKDSLGTQAGFNQLIANDVSSTELEDRVMTAQNRVQNANPEVAQALKAFYPDITNGDILAYALDPTKALDMIKRKVTAAEIGGAALSQGLTTGAQSAENLARYGITAAQAQQGYEQIAGMLPRGSQLADIYKQDPYTQAVSEADVFGTAGSAVAKEKRKKLTALETAAFSGSSGAASNALSRDRASSLGSYRETGAGAF
jgi:hypothetical protein